MIETSFGPSLPILNYAAEEDSDDGYASFGTNLRLDGSYYYSMKNGISFVYLGQSNRIEETAFKLAANDIFYDRDNNIRNNNGSFDYAWKIRSFLIGPVFTHKFSQKIRFDIRAYFGIASFKEGGDYALQQPNDSSSYVLTSVVSDGSSLAYGIDFSMRIPVWRKLNAKWGISYFGSSLGSTSSTSVFQNGSLVIQGDGTNTQVISSLNFSIGLAYHFLIRKHHGPRFVIKEPRF